MTSMLLLGFVMGLQHALEPDHVAAVATIASAQHSVWRSSLVGAAWGIGHTLALMVAGLLVLGLRLTIPESARAFFELGVGIMLIGLGLRAILRAAGLTVHWHAHEHGERSHAHLHLHVGDRAAHEHTHIALSRRSFWVGTVHGLAGSGTLTVLVLAAVPSLAAGLAYILLFGIGSIVAMGLMSTVIGVPTALAARRYGAAHLWIQHAAGIVSVGIGAVLALSTLRTGF